MDSRSVPAESLPFIPCTDFPPVTGWPPLVPDRGSCADGTVEVACKDYILDYSLDRQAGQACPDELSAHDLALRLVFCPYEQQFDGDSCLPPATGWLRSLRAGSCAVGAVEMRHVCHSSWQFPTRRLRCLRPLHLCWAFDSVPMPGGLDHLISISPATGWLCRSFLAGSCADGAVEMIEAQCYTAASQCSLRFPWSNGDGHCEARLGQFLLFLSIWDGAPYTLAGGHKFHLHRQSMLPRLCVLTISFSSCPSLCVVNQALPDTDLFDQAPLHRDKPLAGPFVLCFACTTTMTSSLQCLASYLPRDSAHCSHNGQRGGLRYVSEGHVPSESNTQPPKAVPEGGSTDSFAGHFYDGKDRITFIVICNLQSWLEECIFRCLSLIGLLCLWAAAEFHCFFSTMALLGIVYCFKLWAFALLLRGGTHNCDPLVRASRALTRGCPLHLGVGLRDFSPRLSRVHTPRRVPQRSQIGFSRGFIWFLLLLWLCTSRAEAAQGQRFSSQPTWYPAPDTTHGYTYGPRGLEQQRQAARNFDSSSDEDSPADEESEESDPEGSSSPSSPMPSGDEEERQTCIFKVIGFGHRPEFFCQSCRHGVSLESCLELMDIDLQIKSTSGNGVVVPLQGAAITNELHTMWQPTWVGYALGKLIAIDATLIGLEIFSIYSFSGVMTVTEIRRLLPVLQDREFWVFVPSRQPHPLSPDAESITGRVIVETGDVVHVVPDPLPPAAHHDAETSFQTFPQWGGQDFWDGFELPEGQSYLMLLSEHNPILIPFIPGEQDVDLAARACEQLGIHSPFAAVIRPERPFFQPTHLCFPLAEVIYLLTSPLETWEIVIFLDKRPVCQSFAAVRLPCAVISIQDAVATLRLHVEVVEGHKLWVKGGQTVLGDLVVHHRCILSVRLEHEDCEYFSSEDDGGSFPPYSGAEADGASGSDGRPSTGMLERDGYAGSDIAGTSDSHPGHTASGRTSVRGGLWSRLIVLAQCFTDGQSFQTVPYQATTVIGPQIQADAARCFAAEHWSEKMWKPISFDIYGVGHGADTPRFFSSIGDAASIVLLSRQISELRLCGLILISLSRIPATSGTVVLPIRQNEDDSCDDTVDFRKQRFIDAACSTITSSPFAGDDTKVTALLETDCLVQTGLRTLLDENKGDKLWRLCGALADFLNGIQRPSQHHGADSNDPPLVRQHGSTSRQTLRLQELLSGGNQTSHCHACHLECGVEYEMLDTLLEGHAVQHLDRCIEQAENLHEHARAALRLTPEWDTSEPYSRVVLYTDGSFKPGIAAVGYAVVAIVEVGGQWQFAGHFARVIPATQLGGAVSISAHTAELCGMIHATLLALHLVFMLSGSMWLDTTESHGMSAQTIWPSTNFKSGPPNTMQSPTSLQVFCMRDGHRGYGSPSLRGIARLLGPRRVPMGVLSVISNQCVPVMLPSVSPSIPPKLRLISIFVLLHTIRFLSKSLGRPNALTSTLGEFAAF